MRRVVPCVGLNGPNGEDQARLFTFTHRGPPSPRSGSVSTFVMDGIDRALKLPRRPQETSTSR